MSIAQQLNEKIAAREAVVGVIGLGYVGLPLVLRFGAENFRILGFDVDASKIRALNAGESYIGHIPADGIRRLRERGAFEATDDFSRLAEADCIVICVPTPLTAKREPDLQFIEKTTEAIGRTLRKGQLVILESTTYPGTTEEILLEHFHRTGLHVGEDFLLAFSPEREDPGNTKFSTQKIPKVVGGTTPACLDAAVTLYSQVIDQVVPVSSTQTAELVKLLENIYRSVNIALVNELKMLCDRMKIDVFEVIDAASTKPFGFTPFYPGPGLGGHCIPIDPFYLSWKAREFGFATRFIELAGEVNTAIPHWVVEKLAWGLNDHGKSVRGSRILILGVAYKKDVDDTRESPALEIMELLEERGAKLSYHDSYAPRLYKVRKHDFSNMASQELTEDFLQHQDAILIATDHSDVDYARIVRHAKLVVDTRNATRHVTEGRERIVRA
jgi:UDP-N-acetyl-D-glucosamine dehydrogenase